MNRFTHLLSALLTAVVVGCAWAADPPPVASQNQGTDLLKTDILAVFAHPDDETGAAGTLAAYALGRHSTVTAVYCTRGEGGGNMVGTQSGSSLGLLREVELRACLAKLGIERCFFLDREDFGYTENLLITLEKWRHLQTLEKLIRVVRATRPEVMVTMNPAPTPGQHGNHQAAGILAIEAFDGAANPNLFPEHFTREGLHRWRPRKLYFSGRSETGASIKVDQTLGDGRTLADVVADAVSQHRSQGFGRAFRSPWLRKPQSWTLVKSVVPFQRDETDLFRGLPVTPDVPPRIMAEGDDLPVSGLQFRFRARRAVEIYQQALREQKIEHVATAFVADVPIIAGIENDVEMIAANPSPEAVNATVKFTISNGWKVNPESQMRFSGSKTNLHRVAVTPPPGLPGDAEITAITEIAGTEIRSKARLHAIPRLSVQKSTNSTLTVNAADADPVWQNLRPHRISSTNLWEGSARDDSDSSAQFRIAHDGRTLFLEVRVRDDHLVSNIAPDDIKGHWRSDSVEICIDPAAGAEHTFGCYKLGIFPFDSAGNVRASRDADAHPGLIENTAPNTKLSSWKTPDGYALRISIPFSEAGLDPERDRDFGFNVLIYDGDKPDAAPGENINKSRLAWSPRPGVQGRPDDWGRASFE